MRRDPTNLSRHELIGLEVKITDSDCSTFNNMKGTVINETKNTIKLRTSSGRKIVPKKGKTFVFDIEDKKTALSGTGLVSRPKDRTKAR